MWYWTRGMLKTRAKDILRQRYWHIFLACFIAGALSGAGSGAYSGFSNFYVNFNYPSGYFSDGTSLSTIFLAIFIFLFIFSIAFAIFVGNVVTVGLRRYLVSAQQGKPELNTVLWGFKGGRYMNIVKTMGLYTLYIFLWSLLLIIPGIIKTYEYYYVPYILAENPDIPHWRVFQMSREMTNGEKGDIFVLGLSFFGWAMLGTLACGIGVLFVTPYISATDAELYSFVRHRSLANNITNGFELPGIILEPPPYQQPYYQQQPYPYQQPPYPQQQQQYPYGQQQYQQPQYPYQPPPMGPPPPPSPYQVPPMGQNPYAPPPADSQPSQGDSE